MPDVQPDIAIRHRQGGFTLDAEFSITQPWTVIFGPSGAGKTTLLRILAGLAEPASGRIHLGDRTLLDTATNISVPAGKRSIGFVTQQPALFPHLTARENVAFGIRHLDGDRAHRPHRRDAPPLRSRVARRSTGSAAIRRRSQACRPRACSSSGSGLPSAR